MGSIIAAVGSALRIVGEFFGIIKKNQDLRNTPEMQTNDKAKKEAEIVDHIEKTLEKEDVEETRKLLSD